MRLAVLLIILFSFCKKDSDVGKLPRGATYDKRKNIYTITENGHSYMWTDKAELISSCEVNSFGISDGFCQTFLPGTRKVMSEGRYKNGSRDGFWNWYFEDGKLYCRINHNHEKKRIYFVETTLIGNEHGEYFRYYPDGKLEEKGFFDTGYKDGDWEKFFRDGILEYRGRYKKDKKINEWVYYYSTGKVEAEEKFDSEGNLIKRITFSPEGKKLCEKTKENLRCEKG